MKLTAESFRMTRKTAERVAHRLHLMGRPNEYMLHRAFIHRNGRRYERYCATYRGTVLADAKAWDHHWTPQGLTSSIMARL